MRTDHNPQPVPHNWVFLPWPTVARIHNTSGMTTTRIKDPALLGPGFLVFYSIFFRNSRQCVTLFKYGVPKSINNLNIPMRTVLAPLVRKLRCWGRTIRVRDLSLQCTLCPRGRLPSMAEMN
jgi:hypothetical protein